MHHLLMKTQFYSCFYNLLKKKDQLVNFLLNNIEMRICWWKRKFISGLNIWPNNLTFCESIVLYFEQTGQFCSPTTK